MDADYKSLDQRIVSVTYREKTGNLTFVDRVMDAGARRYEYGETGKKAWIPEILASWYVYAEDLGDVVPKLEDEIVEEDGTKWVVEFVTPKLEKAYWELKCRQVRSSVS